MVRKVIVLFTLMAVVSAAVAVAGCGKKAEEAAGGQQVVVVPSTPATPPAPSVVVQAPPAAGQVAPAAPGAAKAAGPPPGGAPAAMPKTGPATTEPKAPAAPPTAPVKPQAVAGTKPAAQPKASVGDGAGETVVVGTVVVVSNIPDPSQVAYDTCVTFIKYRVESVERGAYAGPELMAVFWGMRGGKLEPAARFTPGQRHRLTIEPFSKHPELARVMQADDTKEYSLKPYWVLAYEAR